MEDKSTPEATTPDAGASSAATDEHSQATDSQSSADKQADTSTKTDDGGKPSESEAATTDDKKSDGGEAAAGKDAPASKFDDDLDGWAEKRGYGTLENDKERRMAQDARNNQREFSRGRQAKDSADDLKKVIDDTKPEGTDTVDENGDPLEKDVADIKAQLRQEKTARVQSEYFTVKNVTKEQADMMGTILKEKVEKAGDNGKEVFEFLTNPSNLSDWHEMALARIASSTDSSEIEKQADAKAREKLARETASTSPNASATQTSPQDKTLNQERSERFSNWD